MKSLIALGLIATIFSSMYLMRDTQAELKDVELSLHEATEPFQNILGEPITPIASINITEYVGLWYEIGSIPFFWSIDCTGTTAQYTLVNNYIKVNNTCHKGSVTAPPTSFIGQAVPDPEQNTYLCVSFFSYQPKQGCANYRIIGVGPVVNGQYQWAAVAGPIRVYGWILSRTPTMDDSVYQYILGLFSAQGFDTSRFKKTLQ